MNKNIKACLLCQFYRFGFFGGLTIEEAEEILRREVEERKKKQK